MFSSILVLCIGNICRSPLAEAYLKVKAAEKGLTLDISSAGLHALVEHPADPQSVKIAERIGLDLSQHKARQVNSKMMKQADLVFVMTQNQLQEVHHRFPETRGKVFLVHNAPAKDIADPYKQEDHAFDRAWEMIKVGVDAWVTTLSPR